MDKVRALAEFLQDPGPVGIFQPVEPFRVQVLGAPWPGATAVVALVAYTNEPPDGLLWGLADPDDPRDPDWHLVSFSLGLDNPLAADPVWRFVRPGLQEWPESWVAANGFAVVAAARRIARFWHQRELQRKMDLLTIVADLHTLSGKHVSK